MRGVSELDINWLSSVPMLVNWLRRLSLSTEASKVASMMGRYAFFTVGNVPHDAASVRWEHTGYGARADVLLLLDARGLTDRVLIADGRYSVRSGGHDVYDGRLCLKPAVAMATLLILPPRDGPAFSVHVPRVMLCTAAGVAVAKARTGLMSAHEAAKIVVLRTVFPSIPTLLRAWCGVDGHRGDQTVSLDFFGSGRLVMSTLVANRAAPMARGVMKASCTVLVKHFEHIVTSWVQKLVTLPELLNASDGDLRTLESMSRAAVRRRSCGRVANLGRAPPCVAAAMHPSVNWGYNIRFQMAEIIAGVADKTGVDRTRVVDAVLLKVDLSKERIRNLLSCVNANPNQERDRRRCVTRGKLDECGVRCVYGSGDTSVQRCLTAAGIAGLNPADVTPSLVWAKTQP